MRNDDYWGPKPAFKYVRIRIIPEQATQIAELISGGVDIIKAVPPDQMDVINKSGAGAHRDLADPAHGLPPARPGRPRGPEPLPGQARAAGRQPGRRHRRRSSSTCSTASVTARRPPSIRWPSASTRASSPTSRTWPRPRSSSPRPASRTGSRSASCAGAADRRARRCSRPRTPSSPTWPRPASGPSSEWSARVGPFTNLVRDSKADPMFEWSWGYYSVFDADAILYDVMTCGEPYSYYCNKALDDLVIQGRSTLDTKKRHGDLHQGPEAPLRRRRLPLQVGAARRLGHQQPHRLRGAARRDRPDVRRDARGRSKRGAHSPRRTSGPRRP